MTHAKTPIRSGWGRFRDWRRTRPFWGGLLLIVAGIELLVAPAAQSLVLPIDLIIYAGVAGVSGALIALLLITLGVLSWFQPAQHVFFGIVGILLALVSFLTSNFGGFVIGMLLGIVGGALVFAWAPDVRRRSRSRRRARASDTPEVTDDIAEVTDDTEDQTETVKDPRKRPDTLAILALPLAVAVTIASAPAPTLGWPWDWLLPGDDEEQSEEQPSDPPSDGATDGPEPTDPGDDGDSDEDSDDPESDEDDDRDEDEQEDREDDEEILEECDFRVGDAAMVEDEDEFLAAVRACQAAEEEGDMPEVAVDSDAPCFQGSVRESGLTADRLTMRGARYEGVVECPTADGPERYIRLTMSSSDLVGGELWFQDAGARMSLELPTMNLTGDVELHITRMHVRILGIPLTFTPDFPPPLLLPFMVVTDVDVDNPLASTDSMTIPNLNARHNEAAGR